MPSISCPLCSVQVSADKVSLAQHFVDCGVSTLNACVSDGSIPPNSVLIPDLSLLALSSSSPPLSSSPLPLSLPSPPASPSSPKKRGASPKKAKGKKKIKTTDGSDEDSPPPSSSPKKAAAKKPTRGKKTKEEDEGDTPLSPSPSLSSTPPTTTITTTTVTTTTTTEKKKEKKEKKEKIKMTEQEYDDFLKNTKGGRFKRTGKWQGFTTNTDHKCTDPECAREWRPAPEKCLPDDYYCPSCVLHHRNNVDRFNEPRLVWTAVVPNSFYVFSITDPKTKTKLVKFGRTQHLDVWKRYPTKEVKDYKMELLMALRGKLITMTKIENWWKEHADENKLFCRFSESEFHGATECLELDEKTLKFMQDKSNEMHLADP
eukprot:Phypoly_transcript_10389.p1 GENE.Phypoly_transcript_10389~~Phypoly_transcript_10389.p1  ORF type:complete len:373 (+),score=117.49 Phypoly_transcript_10389:10-1128(+)